MDPETFDPRSHPYRWVVLAGAWLLYFSFGLTVASVPPLVQPIGAALNMDNAAMGGVLGAWQLVYIASAIPCGAMLDRLGPRRALLIGVAVIAVSGALRGLADGSLALFFAVAVFGIGGPVISVGAPKLVGLWFSDRQRGLAMGIYVTGSNVGAVTALSITNAVMMPLFDGDWRAVLFTYAGFALVAAAVWLAICAHPVSRAVERRIAAAPKTSQIRQFGELLRLPAVRVVLAISIGVFFFNHGLGSWLPEILRTGGMTPATAGLWAAAPTAVAVIASLTIPRLATDSRRLRVLAASFTCALAATLLLRVHAGPWLAAGLVLQGIAAGSMMAVAMLALMAAPGVGGRNTGLAGGLFFSAAEIGGVLGPLTVGALSARTGGFSLPLAVLSAVTIGLLLLLPLLRRGPREPLSD